MFSFLKIAILLRMAVMHKFLLCCLIMKIVIFTFCLDVHGQETHAQKIYPYREREYNIRLIKSILYSENEMSYNKAITIFQKEIHPSLFAELDFMERTMPYEQRIKTSEFIDNLFLVTLENNIKLRFSQF